MTTKQQNWAGNIDFAAASFHQPQSVTELQEIVRRADRVSVVGARHSFSPIADTTGDLLSLEQLDGAPIIDEERRTVTASGGTRYGHLAEFVYNAGYALHNMASLPHISLAGACATATHGSGDGNGNLATAVSALEFVAADGELVKLSREDEEFEGAVVNLGGLGVVTRMTLDLEPSFNVRQAVYAELPLAQVDAHFDEIMASGYSVSLFTDWQHEHVNRVWVKRRVVDNEESAIEPSFFGASLARTDRDLLTKGPVDQFTQVGMAGAWYERLPHFRLENTLLHGNELQSEYFVARRHAVAALQAVAGLREQMAPLLAMSEVRTVAADELWMSTAYGQDIVGLHFTWHKDVAAVMQFLPRLEARLAPFTPRPHWGKLFALSPKRVQAEYERLGDFRELLERYDSQGKFRNAFLDRYVFGAT